METVEDTSASSLGKFPCQSSWHCSIISMQWHLLANSALEHLNCTHFLKTLSNNVAETIPMQVVALWQAVSFPFRSSGMPLHTFLCMPPTPFFLWILMKNHRFLIGPQYNVSPWAFQSEAWWEMSSWASSRSLSLVRHWIPAEHGHQRTDHQGSQSPGRSSPTCDPFYHAPSVRHSHICTYRKWRLEAPQWKTSHPCWGQGVCHTGEQTYYLAWYWEQPLSGEIGGGTKREERTLVPSRALHSVVHHLPTNSTSWALLAPVHRRGQWGSRRWSNLAKNQSECLGLMVTNSRLEPRDHWLQNELFLLIFHDALFHMEWNNIRIFVWKRGEQNPGEKAGATETMMKSCSRTPETALEGLSGYDLGTWVLWSHLQVLLLGYECSSHELPLLHIQAFFPSIPTIITLWDVDVGPWFKCWP